MITDNLVAANIFPNVVFSGTVLISDYCVIGQESYQLRSKRSSSVCVIGDGFSLGPFSFIGKGTSIGQKFRGDSHSYIGENCDIGDSVVVEYGARIYDGCRIGDCSQIGGFVCNDVEIGEASVIQGSLIHSRAQHDEVAPPKIGSSVLVGTGALVVGGVKVGDEAVIAAGAVLLKDAKPGRLYAGVPAVDKGVATWS
ncbi:hypothetical protein [Actinomyces sp. oral taxon 849]|jgi:acetyltransferase|uniref:hypothetical protein n=1 Tax=Actinomyces sp. oral taxon 849 TaxID=653385 RepID=UPI000A002B2F|nr:hypothetical protein [Actinomyces sp. oral taxon 849]